jgi:hypothetical protein
MAHCEYIRMSDGSVAIVRLSGRRRETKRCKCGAPATRECDYPIARRKTCDAPMCDAHSHSVGRDLDYCDAHHSSTRPAA